MFQSKNKNKNFYYIKEIQWSNRAMKLNQLNAQINNKNNIENKNSIKENLNKISFNYKN